MAKNDNLKDFLIDVANAIRTKKGTSEEINPQNFSDEILQLESADGGKINLLLDGSITKLNDSDFRDITRIRNHACYGCENLSELTIPSNITTIGTSAFEGCSSLQTLHIADGVTTISASAFKGINASIIDIPSTLSVLETEVFADNLALTSITIPENITEIKDNAFSGCTNLTEITMDGLTPPVVTNISLPASVTTIYVKYGAYESYLAQWSDYSSKIVRLPAIPSSITVIVNNYLNELVQGASVTVSGNEQTFTGTTNENGVFVVNDLQPATYTVSVADIDGFKTPESLEVVVEENTQKSAIITYLEKPSQIPFAEATPSKISEISAEISANNMTTAEVEATYGWKLGDTIDITLTTSEVIQMRIIGFNHDNKSDGSGKAGITLEMVNCLAQTYRMGINSVTSGGFAETSLKGNLSDIKATLPQEWQNIIKLVDKKSADGGGYYYHGMNTTMDDLFLLAGVEVFGSESSYGLAQGGANEGVQYEYWKGKVAGDRIKKYDKNRDGICETNITWWLRSCYKDGINHFCSVLSSGEASIYSPGTYLGVSFAFCV